MGKALQRISRAMPHAAQGTTVLPEPGKRATFGHVRGDRR